MKDIREKLYSYIDGNIKHHADRIMEMIRQPSVSATGEGIPEMAGMLVDRLSSLGAAVKAEPTEGNPIVYGSLGDKNKKTILFYILYDVQPASAEGWLVPPFSPSIVDFPPYGPSIVGRGAFNSKGPLGAFINVLESIKQLGEEVPVNILFLIEGEEELGSKSLPAFIKKHEKELRKADAVFQPYFGETSLGIPVIYLGCKGLIYFELICRGGDWGGPVEREIHALNNAWIGSPVWRLIQALATIKEPGVEERTAIEGWYNKVLIPPEEEPFVKELSLRFNPEALLKEQGARRFKLPEGSSTEEIVKAYLYEPSINIDGIYAGYTGDGTKTVMPNLAVAKMDIRPLPDMEPQEILRMLRQHLDNKGFGDLEIRVQSSVPWSRNDPSSPAVKALIDILKEHGEKDPLVWPRSAGMVPHHLFTKGLGLPVAFGGLGHGGRAHSINEYITLEGLRRHERGIASFLYNCAE